jgi:AcrR family transcriptional regulator
MSGQTVHGRRRYDSKLRRERATETRERIIAAGCDILHASSIRDWRALTIRAVAERAGVNERTVYRHFVNERGLRDAVMHRLEERAGVDLATLRLEDVGEVAARIFAHVASYPLDRRAPQDPTLVEANERQRAALLAAVEAKTPRWSADERLTAAAMLDVLWSVSAYERLVVDWGVESERAIDAVRWAIRLVEDAVREGPRPASRRSRRPRRAIL